MEGEELDAEEVLAVGDALGEVERVPAVVADDIVDAPGSRGGVEVILGDLEPLEPLEAGGGGVVDAG